VVLVRGLEERGVKCTVFQQTDVRMCPASAELRQAIIEGKLTHDGDEELARHIATAIAKQGRRGWRLDKQREDDQIDAAISLVMAYEAATAPEPPPSKMYLV
jgi:phage terminase large subunit-like protein